MADGARAGCFLTWGHLGNEQSCVKYVLEREVEKYIWVYVGISPLAKVSKDKQSYSKPCPSPTSTLPWTSGIIVGLKGHESTSRLQLAGSYVFHLL